VVNHDHGEDGVAKEGARSMVEEVSGDGKRLLYQVNFTLPPTFAFASDTHNLVSFSNH
jgi:hypothetical protein